MGKQMEGDNRERRKRAREARDDGRQASEDKVTLGASKQRDTLPQREDADVRLGNRNLGKQKT